MARTPVKVRVSAHAGLDTHLNPSVLEHEFLLGLIVDQMTFGHVDP